MIKSSAWLFAGAVLATAGLAHAQESTPVAPAAEAAAAQAGMPWYQRFTTSNGLTEAITGDRENDRLLPQAWTLNQHWGVTVDVREASAHRDRSGSSSESTVPDPPEKYKP